jgi:hypothetical protein
VAVKILGGTSVKEIILCLCKIKEQYFAGYMNFVVFYW